MAPNWIDMLGFVASAFTLATFAQRTMAPMRIVAICANLCFIGYGALGGYMPVLALHLILLPLNLLRLKALLARPDWAELEQPPAASHAGDALQPGVSSGLI